MTHDSPDKFDRQIIVSIQINQMNHEKSVDVVVGFVHHGPGHGTVYRCSELSVIPHSCPGTQN